VDPWLAAARVMVWADEGRLDELDAWIDEDLGRTVDGYPYALVRALHRCKSGDLGRADQELEAAARLRDEAEPFWPTVERCVRAAVACWSGDLRGCRKSAAAAATLAESYGNVAGRTYSLGYLALAHLDEGDVPSAACRLAQVDDQLRPGSDLSGHFVLTLPLLVAGRLHRQAGRTEEALADLERAVSTSRLGAAVSSAWRRWAGWLTCSRSRVGARRRRRCATRPPHSCATARTRGVPPRSSRTTRGCHDHGPREAGEEFTAREFAVLQLLPTRRSLRTIAADLYVSHNTVKTHTRSLLPQARGLDEGGGRPAGQGGGPAVAGPGR
jgi:LuxR family transcriptional regulator, maltose regulon positive regulatory protein